MHKRIAILLMIVLAVFVAISIHRPKIVHAAGAQNNYVTGFSLTENPISESGNWVNGKTTGVRWGDMQTFGGHIGGTNTNGGCSGGNPNACNDSVAALTGTWTVNQAVCATVFIDPTLSRTSGTYEIEIHLHQSFTSASGGNASGYEFNYSMFNNGSQYAQIVRWDGYDVSGNQHFTVIGGTSGVPAALNNGDIFCASAVAGLLRSWVVRSNAVLQTTNPVTDTTYTGGAPGLGSFNGAGTLADNAKFGFSQFEATNAAAQTGNQADVNSVTNGPLHTAVDGESILMPPGAYTWTSTSVTATVGLQFFGYGIPNTSPVIANNGASASCSATAISTSGSSPFKFQPTAVTASLSRMSCMAMNYVSPSVSIAISGQGVCNVTTCTNIRMDNVTFNNWSGHGTSGGISFGIGVLGDFFGVIDHNTVNGNPGGFLQLIETQHASYQGVGQYGDNSWAQPENYGSNNFLFFENNLFNNASATENEANFGGNIHQGGGRQVVRFNTFNINDNLNFTMGWHGTESNGRPRGGRAWEYYENLDNYPASCTGGGCAPFIGTRSGTGMTWGNTINSATIHAGGVNLTTALVEGTSGTWPACDGTAAKDGVDPAGVQFSGTISNIVIGNPTIITVSGTPGWQTNQWSKPGGIAGQPYSMHDVTESAAKALSVGSEIVSNTSNTLSLLTDGGPASMCKTSPTPTCIISIGDSIQITRSFWCMDQAGGRGAGNLFSGAGQNFTASNEVLSPAYFWMTAFPNQNPGEPVVFASTARVIQNRDYYIENTLQAAQTSPTSPFDGTTTTICTGGTLACGIGHGVKANRPVTCTTGVAYWATDEGTWNTVAGGVQGNLYICTATNTWTLSYTPFTYPHPLVGGSVVTGPAVTFSPNSINFGTVNIGVTSAAQTITITNAGTANLTWTAYSTTNPANTTFTASGGTCPQTNAAGLAAGASCTVSVTGLTNSTGLQQGTFNLPSNAPGSPQTVPLSITGNNPAMPGVSISPTSFDFGTLTASTVFTVTSNGTANLVLGTPLATLTGTNAADFSLQAVANQCVNGQSMPPSTTCPIQVGFAPQAVGARSGNLNVFDNVTGSPQVIPLTGTGQALSSSSPPSLLFGGVVVNQSANLNVTLQSVGNAPLTVTSIVQIGTGFTQTNNCGTSVGAGLSCIVQVTFAPTATGTASGTLTITDNSPSSPHRVPATGSGILVPTTSTGVTIQGSVQQ